MSVITTILSPPFLANNIELIAFVISVMVLIFFDELVAGRIIFPIADYIKYKLASGIDRIYEGKNITTRATWARYLRKYSSEAVATVLVIVYCYVGYAIIGVFIIEPLLERWKGIISVVVLIVFLITNYLVNDPKMRRQIFGFGIYNPGKNLKK